MLAGSFFIVQPSVRLESLAGCFTLFVLLVSRYCCLPLPNDATGLSAVCD